MISDVQANGIGQRAADFRITLCIPKLALKIPTEEFLRKVSDAIGLVLEGLPIPEMGTPEWETQCKLVNAVVARVTHENLKAS